MEMHDAVRAAWTRLDAGDAVGAARLVEQHESEIDTDEELATLWSALLDAVGRVDVLRRQIRRLSASWPRQPQIALNCARAATRWRDPWPPDSPPPGLPQMAADVVARCLAGRPSARWQGPLHAARARALARVGPAHDDEALSHFEIALYADPENAVGWAELARFHQMRRRWAKGLGAAQQALEFDADLGAARWTAAACATALADASATTLWASLDHLAEGVDADGRPAVAGLPAVEVVLTSVTPGPGEAFAQGADAPTSEAVWVHPISPVHGRVASPTVLDLPADHDDVLIWDPLPLEFRDDGETETPRFAALAVLSRGRTRTWRYRGRADDTPWPPGWAVYPFAGRVVGSDAAADGKLVAPRAVDVAAVDAALRARNLARV